MRSRSSVIVARACACVWVALLCASSAPRGAAGTNAPAANASQRGPAREPAAAASEVQAPVSAPRGVAQDPTLTDPELERALGAAAPRSADAREQTALPSRLPTLVLRALVVARGKPGVAIVELDGKLHRVGAGDVFAASAERGQQIELRVVSLTRDEVRIEARELGQTVTLR